MSPLERLRHHVTGAIERGEAAPIVEVAAPVPDQSECAAALAMLRDECRDWQDVLCGERPSLDHACIVADRALAGVSQPEPSLLSRAMECLRVLAWQIERMDGIPPEVDAMASDAREVIAAWEALAGK